MQRQHSCFFFMLTYSSNAQPQVQPTEKPWLLLLLTFLWLWPGVLGHDPWRPDEPYVLAVIDSMLATGNWMYPTIQSDVFLQYPPLYYWVSMVFIKLLSPWLLPVHDAARLATPFLMALALLFAGSAGRELIGRYHGRSVVLVMIGCLGLMATGHQLTPTVAAYTGYAAAFYALVVGLRLVALGGVLLGGASVVLCLSASLLEVGLVWAVVLLLPAFSAWRSRRYMITVAMALLFGLPLALIWPMALAKSYPDVLQLWWQVYAVEPLNGFYRLGMFHDLGYYVVTSLWYGWPAWPLAGWTLYRNRRYDEPLLQLPLMFFGVIIILLTFSGRQKPENTMPLLLPLSVLAAVELDTVKRSAAALLNWFGLMSFGFFGLVIWLGWFAVHFGWPAELYKRAYYFSPDYQADSSILPTLSALLATLVWLWAVTRRHLRGRQAVTNWAAGITVFWGLAATLALPWIDAFKSYRRVVERMEMALPAEVHCIATDNLFARVTWSYYANRRLWPYDSEVGNHCNYRLIVRPKSVKLVDPDPHWQDIWSGSRPREKREVFVLQQRTANVT